MSTKKVYFYRVDLVDKNRQETVVKDGTYLIKEILAEIINKASTQVKNYKTIDLTYVDEDLHTIMDVFDFEDDFMFCRLSRQQANNSVIHRTYDTYKPDAIFDEENNSKEGIEVYTYCRLDYETGIFSIIESKSAPKAKCICRLFEIYNTIYEIKLIDIPNDSAIDVLYSKEGACITKLEFEIPRPSQDAMEKLLEWKDNDIMNNAMKETIITSITMRPQRGGKFTGNTDETKRFIENLRDIKSYTKAKIKGYNKEMNPREFDLYAKYFSYPVDIENYKKEKNIKVYYTIEELLDIYKTKLKVAFEINKSLLKLITDR